jgi:rhodanese-related sulfurtransferase
MMAAIPSQLEEVIVKRLLMLTLSVFLVLQVACSKPAPATPQPTPEIGKREVVVGGFGYRLISPQELEGMLAAKQFTLVNVHTPYEGEIQPTDLFLVYDTIAQHVDQLPDKAAPIVLYCRSGRMSAEAATTLAKLGYTHLYDLEGGMIAWEAAGFPLIK